MSGYEADMLMLTSMICFVVFNVQKMALLRQQVMNLRKRSREDHKKAIKINVMSQKLSRKIKRAQDVEKHNVRIGDDCK